MTRAYLKEGLLVIEEEKGVRKPKVFVDVYKTAAVESQIGGRGFELKRLTLKRGELEPPGSYHVLLGGEYGDECDCPGWVRWGSCRHIRSLREVNA